MKRGVPFFEVLSHNKVDIVCKTSWETAKVVSGDVLPKLCIDGYREILGGRDSLGLDFPNSNIR